MDPQPLDRPALIAALLFQMEAGADECIGAEPVDRFAAAAAAREAAAARAEARAPLPKPAAPAALSPKPPAEGDAAEAVTEARRLAAAAKTLDELRAAIEGFEGCALKQGARNTVFADGDPAARVMFVGEAPGRDEDREGKPFVGRSGQLLDRMLAAIGLDRRSAGPERGAYITNLLPWRPAGDRDPASEEAAMLLAFLERHIELAAPEIVVTLGRAPASALFDESVSITRARGRWRNATRAGGRPVLPTLHPAYLLRQPAEKAKAWRDLLSLRAVLDGAPPPEAR